MKKVLIITYYWPPAGGSGVQRTLKFAKYFRDFGWEPIIYTCENPEVFAWDESLLEEVPKDIEIHKKKITEPFAVYKKFIGGDKSVSISETLSQEDNKSLKKSLAFWMRGNLFFPDAKALWINPSVRYLSLFLKDHPVDMILSSSPPPTVQLIAYKLAKKTGLPWVADFRDPWTKAHFYQHLKLTNFTKSRHLRAETKVLHKANAVSVVSKGMAADFEDRARKIKVVYNGYDTEDFEPKVKRSDKFVISYIGNFKPNQNVPVFFKALGELKSEIDGLGEDMSLEITGKAATEVLDSIADNGLEENLIYSGSVAHSEAVKQMQEAHLLLLVIPNHSSNKTIITGKIFEYMAAQTEILGIGPIEGDAHKILSKCCGQGIVDYGDLSALKERIDRSYKAWKSGLAIAANNMDEVELYSRRGQTGSLAELMNSCLK